MEFATYKATRKANLEEQKEYSAYPDANVTTWCWGIKGLTDILNEQFGENFVEEHFDGNLTEIEKEQIQDGYVRYWIEIAYCEGIDLNGVPYAREESWGGMHKYV